MDVTIKWPYLALHSCSLDISPLQQLARQSYGAEVIKYAGGSPLKGAARACQQSAVNDGTCDSNCCKTNEACV